MSSPLTILDHQFHHTPGKPSQTDREFLVEHYISAFGDLLSDGYFACSNVPLEVKI